jgi:hypothetical protein
MRVFARFVARRHAFFVLKNECGCGSASVGASVSVSVGPRAGVSVGPSVGVSVSVRVKEVNG